MVDLAAACQSWGGLTQSPPFTYELPGGLEVVVVSQREQLEPALARLHREAAGRSWWQVPRGALIYRSRQAATTSPLVAIDLEWRPDFQRGEDNPVALVQLAAGALCVLVRTCVLGLPAELRAFFR